MQSGQATPTSDRVIKTEATVAYKPSHDSRSLRAVVITNNDKKFEEFRTQLGDGYGMDIMQWQLQSHVDLTNEAQLAALLTEVMSNYATSPHFVLREDTTLVSQKDGRDLTHLPLVELAKLSLESVLHTSALTVCKPQWKDKQLTGFSIRKYERRSYGYINPNNSTCERGFGWDALFVNAATNLTNEQFYQKYGKKSARQHTISDFIETYLRYKTLTALKYHSLPMTSPIDFGKHFISPIEFVNSEKNMSNPFIGDWGIDRLRNNMINEGIFFKAAWSRPVRNYFSPGFSGLPFTAKKDAVEETIYMTHDMLHHLVCDLICDMPSTRDGFYVYSAWRMMSEACTMALADMFYADGLMKFGVDRSCVDKRIYPLFEAIKAAQNIPDPKQMNWDDKIAFIKKILTANVRYALLGDDGGFVELLTHDGKVDPDHLQRLEAYKNHFGKFFIGDNAWTSANYYNMYKNSDALHQWINDVSPQTFRDVNIPLLSDTMSDLAKRGVRTDNYERLVVPLFDYLFETKIKPHLMSADTQFLGSCAQQSNAFRRYLIGQSSLFSRFPSPLNLDHIPAEIFAKLKFALPFTNDAQDKIRKLLAQYILGIEGLRLMSRAEALNAMDCTPIFPPVYVSYVDVQKQYGSIANCVNDCIANYKQPVADRLFSRAQTNPQPLTGALVCRK